MFTTGTLRIRLNDPQHFLDFGERAADGDIDHARRVMAGYEAAFDEKPSALRDEPDRAVVEEWLLRVRSGSSRCGCRHDGVGYRFKVGVLMATREDAVCPASPDQETAFRIEDVGTTFAWDPDPYGGVFRATVTRPAWEAAMMGHLRSRPDEEHRRLHDLCVTDLIAAGITLRGSRAARRAGGGRAGPGVDARAEGPATRLRRRRAPLPESPTAVEVCADFEPYRLIPARNLLGWTRRDLSDATGIEPVRICHWESAISTPKAYELEKVAEATGHLVAFFKRGRPMVILDSSGLFMCSVDR